MKRAHYETPGFPHVKSLSVLLAFQWEVNVVVFASHNYTQLSYLNTHLFALSHIDNVLSGLAESPILLGKHPAY